MRFYDDCFWSKFFWLFYFDFCEEVPPSNGFAEPPMLVCLKKQIEFVLWLVFFNYLTKFEASETIFLFLYIIWFWLFFFWFNILFKIWIEYLVGSLFIKFDTLFFDLGIFKLLISVLADRVRESMRRKWRSRRITTTWILHQKFIFLRFFITDFIIYFLWGNFSPIWG